MIHALKLRWHDCCLDKEKAPYRFIGMGLAY